MYELRVITRFAASSISHGRSKCETCMAILEDRGVSDGDRLNDAGVLMDFATSRLSCGHYRPAGSSVPE